MRQPRQPPQPLPHILPESEIEHTILRHIDQHTSLVDKLLEASRNPAAGNTASFEKIVRPLADLENAQAGEKAVIAGLKYFSPNQHCQALAEKAELIWDEYFLQQKSSLYQLLEAVPDVQIDPESQRFLEKLIRECKDDETDKGSSDVEAIRNVGEKNEQINQLCIEINRNLRHYTGGEWFSQEEVEGVPLGKQEKSPDGRCDGKALYLHNEKYFSIMRYAHSSKTRRRMLEGHHFSLEKNGPLFEKVILLRDENARALGFKNHAEFKLSSRCVESIEWVEHMLLRLEEALLPVGKKQFDRVQAKKRRLLSEGLGPRIKDSIPSDLDGDCLMQWEYLYYDSLPENGTEGDKVGAVSLAEWFPLEQTFQGMLDLFSDCLKLRFDSLPHEEVKRHLWHDDVEAWAVWDEADGQFVGYLFADLLSRPHKYKGNQAVSLQPGYEKPDGTRVYPANIIMINFANLNPTTGRLLEHSNVVTMFHELGHCIHSLIARTKYSRFHGYEVALEFGEGIAMVLEQWCWLPEELKALSCHYTKVNPEYAENWKRENPGRDLPPEHIPDDRMQKQLSKRKVFKANKILSLLISANFDMAIHNSPTRESMLQMDLSSLYSDIYKRLKFRRIPKKSFVYAQEGLLVSGYDAGYYSYLYAEILAADFFQSNFAENPRSHEAWSRFRESILEKGGSRDELSMIREFNGGRSIDVEKFLSLLRGAVDLV